ncbi:Hypothetical protein CINCED_3A001976 [Cinara cedri]|uniref:Lipase domain-containing protein n=1 Tax=Cinara cedri TaxID=506608 RepID=A0A5E4LZY5_9HEMI|nr:Hypothetical protein CINCED_3A001976 [Cinara cedri]
MGEISNLVYNYLTYQLHNTTITTVFLSINSDHGWQRGGFPWQKPEEYSNVVYYNLPHASNILADFVLKKIPEHVKVHLIGFSLGGQLAGIASRIMKNHKLKTIDRISAIDPAGPLFEYTLNLFTIDSTHTLRKTDAVFVDVVHACLLLGMQKEAGHLDVFIKDVDCKHPYCLHQRSFDAFIASLTTCSQITCPHSNINSDLDCNVPDRTHLSSIGYLADLYSGRGKHVIYLYRKENGQKVSTGNCTEYLKVNLPVKHRICLDTNDCGKKPYLSECHMPCTGEKKSTSICGINETNRAGSSSNQNKNTKISPRVSWSEVTDRQKCGKALSCTIEKSVPVQYYVAYKKPNTLEYFYISRSEDGSSVTEQPGLHKFSYPESVLGQTLAPIYEHGNSITYTIWNDDVPYDYILNDTRSNSYGIPVDVTSFGHSKGVLAYSKHGGFLMSHSIPQYPPNPNDKPYQYPLSEKKYAQMALCVTSNQYSSNVVDEIEALLDLIINFKPYVYASHVQLNDWPIRIRNKFETLVHPKDNKLQHSPVINNKHYGRNFIEIHSFGRSSDAYFQDSIEKLAEYYSTSMLTKSRLGNTLPSNCNHLFTIENIKVIRLLNSNNTEHWSKTADHTNWIVSKTFEKNLMCVGDLYRDKYIIARGGMFVCIQDIDLYIAYLKAVHFDFQACQH